MSRGLAVVTAFAVVGGLGTAMIGRWDAFSIGFAFVFWGGLAAAITWIAGRRGKADQTDVLPILNPDTEVPIQRSTFNPATGLLMASNDHGMDLGGNAYGTTDASDTMASVHHPSSGAHGGL